MNNLAGDPASKSVLDSMEARLKTLLEERGDRLAPCSEMYGDWYDEYRRIVKNAWGPLGDPSSNKNVTAAVAATTTISPNNSKKTTKKSRTNKGDKGNNNNNNTSIQSNNRSTYSARYLADNGLQIQTDDQGRVTARPPSPSTTTATTTIGNNKNKHTAAPAVIQEQSATPVPQTGFNVVLTHCTADFDSLASAVGLAKLWSSAAVADDGDDDDVSSSSNSNSTTFDSASHLPTFVVLPRGAHPGVQRFLGLHKHLFPIRSLKSLLQSDHLSSLNRLGLVDAQRRDRIGPAEPLLPHANRITVVDHHVDQDSDINADDYVVDQVGSVSTLMAERLQKAADRGLLQLSQAEATLLALGIHADTGSLCFDSTTVRDAAALAWLLGQGASQAAIAEHAQSSLSREQQGVLTQAS